MMAAEVLNTGETGYGTTRHDTDTV